MSLIEDKIMAKRKVEKMYVLRSKKSGKFFKWVEYSDDGWGKYVDDISKISPEDIPSFFNEYTMFQTNIRREATSPWMSLKDHTPDEVEIVVVDMVLTRLEE